MDANHPSQAVEASLERAEKAVAELSKSGTYYPAALMRLLASVRHMACEAASFDPQDGSIEKLEQRLFMMFFASAAGAAQDVAIQHTAFLDFGMDLRLAFDDLSQSVDHASRS